MGKQEKSTKPYKKPGNPAWEEGFCFLVNNPEDDYIVFKVVNEKDDQILGIWIIIISRVKMNHTIIIGEFIYSISALFGEINLEIVQQTFKLAQCKSEGKINLSMALKVSIPFSAIFLFYAQ